MGFGVGIVPFNPDGRNPSGTTSPLILLSRNDGDVIRPTNIPFTPFFHSEKLGCISDWTCNPNFGANAARLAVGGGRDTIFDFTLDEYFALSVGSSDDSSFHLVDSNHIIVHVGDIKFHLHKFPLLPKSSLLQKLLMASNDDKVDEICITYIPGGLPLDVQLSTWRYTKQLRKGTFNLAYKIEVFLRTSIFRSWKDSIVVLHTTRSLLPWVENLEFITHCIDSSASKACVDTSKVELSYTYNKKQLLSEVLNLQQWNGVRK
ncbi:hypothetical protein ZIOFF_043735 [Zingiber officinale]|uniref:BTB domain-containing protein n=1 Tax=Zingiber officinale TaxID=94328 RepID=A0A8J5G4Q8_ZINOF|nr:hypothetical protein ZIOFF_043735 [Zingiber officinale]